jgi:hypothetical protein
MDRIGYVHGGFEQVPARGMQFEWLEEEDAGAKTVWDALPQIVLADFPLDGCSPSVRTLVHQLLSPPGGLSLADVDKLARAARENDTTAAAMLVELVRWELQRRPHRLPTLAEYQHLQEENGLIAWTALHARDINHFGVAAYTCATLKSVESFHTWLSANTDVVLAQRGGQIIQGGPALGLAQSSTVPGAEAVELPGGEVQTAGGFVELVWRFRQHLDRDENAWNAYFRGYVSSNARPVAETSCPATPDL